MKQTLTSRTIDDFGDQWTRYANNDGYYGSSDILVDVFGPLLPPEALKGKKVLEIGSGTGRIVHMLLAAGAAHVTAVEPSQLAGHGGVGRSRIRTRLRGRASRSRSSRPTDARSPRFSR